MNSAPKNTPRLGVNLDHIATLRQARFTPYPDLCDAIRLVENAGADGITLHLREDRRHIQDADLLMAKTIAAVPLNMEMAATDTMLKIATRLKPNACCIVPEKREELTTEGGLDVFRHEARLKELSIELHSQSIRVSLFVEPDEAHLDIAAAIGVPIVELHTGAYANRTGANRDKELDRIRNAARHAANMGLEVHAGHGLDYGNVREIAGIAEIHELNIGHSIVCRALFVGLGQAVLEMRRCMQDPV